ncbi:MAG: hypothetical protein Q7J84_11260 [Sulfuricaulis sp.]|nr:hypothetical protein [Sulfuricaulis sp.]
MLKVLRSAPIIIVLSLCLNACALSAAKYMVSSATSESSSTSVTKDGKLRLQGLVIVVKPANSLIVAGGSSFIFDFLEEEKNLQAYTYTSLYYDDHYVNTKDSFILEILVSTNDYEMNLTPMKISVAMAGKETYPISYYVLEPRYSGTGSLPVFDLCKRPGAESWNSDNALKTEKENRSAEPIPLTQQNRYCFAVKYGMPPIDPRSVFSVEIEGLSIDGKAVAPPVIRYVPDTYIFRSA